jgi:hypothetical protein
LKQNKDRESSKPTNRKFLPRLDINFLKKSKAAKELGLLGKELVVSHEIAILENSGHQELADKVVHISKVKGDGAGYDILSYFDDGRKKYIEVKTTTFGPKIDFFLTPNELAFSAKFPNHFVLYRLYHFSREENSAEMSTFESDLEKQFDLTPTEFRVCNMVTE